ncbi:PAP2 family protein, partial [human gut metagenome]
LPHPESLTFFFSNVTSLINIPVIITWVVVLVGLFLYKKWFQKQINQPEATAKTTPSNRLNGMTIANR